MTPELYLRLKEGGRDSWLALDTANRSEAARRARDLWVRVAAQGLEAVLREINPQARPERAATVGEILTVAREISAVRAQVFAGYEAALRFVFGGVLGFSPKSDRHPDRAAWRAKIDAVRLDRVAPASVEAWRRAELDAARREGGEAARERRAHTIATKIRNAKALFGKALLPLLRARLQLPDPLPFAGVSAPPSRRRFRLEVDPRAIYAAAEELDLDTRAALDLLLLGGLRRGEADALRWTSVDLTSGVVRIEHTQDFRPKSAESARAVPLPADAVERLRKARAASPEGEYVLQPRRRSSARKSHTEKGSQYVYRARAWDGLSAWLRAQGVTQPNPLHVLRKMSGSLAYLAGGIEAARRHLGHASVTTTSASYLGVSAVVVDLTGPGVARSKS